MNQVASGKRRVWAVCPATLLVLLGILGLYAALTYYAAQRQLWFDELFTYYVARSPSFAAMLANIRHMQEIRVDMNPPLMYLAARGSMAILGDSAYAARFPAIAGLLVGSWSLYRFAARRYTAAFGLLAVMVFWSTPFLQYATEARAYGLITGFFGLAMLAYDSAARMERRRSAILLLALAVAGMMLSHFLAVFYLIPFGFAELVRTIRRRAPDLPVWSALLLPCFIPLAYLRSMGTYQQILFPREFQASLRQVFHYFSFSLKTQSFALLVAAGVALLVATRLKSIRTNWRLFLHPRDTAFAAGLLLIPLAVALALMHSRGAFFPRYGIVTALAYGLIYAAALAAWTERQPSSAAVASAVLAIYVCAYNIADTHKVLAATHHQFFEAGQRTMPLTALRPDLPLVTASGLTFLEMDHYSNETTCSRLFYLTGGELSVRYAHANMFERMPELKKYLPIRGNLLPYTQFVSEHPHFLVLGTTDYPEDWLLRYLLDTRADVRLLGKFEGPYKDHDVYEVTIQNE